MSDGGANIERPEQAFAVAVHAVVLRLRRLGERRLGIEPLPLSEVDTLTYVIDHPGSTVTDVAQALALQVSNVSATVRYLVSRGLLVRKPDPNDGRRSLLDATPQAVDDRDRIHEAWTRVVGEFLNSLPEDERRAALGAVKPLQRLADIALDPPE